MTDMKKAVIAICFNDVDKARALAQKLMLSGFQLQFVINANFDAFLKELSTIAVVDCFIVEEKFNACSAIDLMGKIKKSKKYKKTVTVMKVDELTQVNDGIVELNLDLLYSDQIGHQDFSREINKLIVKRQMPTIPPDCNVLVLDNNETILELISLHLDHMDHRAYDLCTSIAAAKRLLVEKRYKLLLLDWNLDDGTCLELIEFIQSDKKSMMLCNHQALSVVITGRSDVDDIMTLLRYGIKDHIIKPFDFDEFEEKITYALEKHRKKSA